MKTKQLMIYYSAVAKNGERLENNIVLKDIQPIRRAEDLVALQDFIQAMHQHQTVRIIHFQRLEGHV